MTASIEQSQAESILANIRVPARPQSLLEFLEEANRPQPRQAKLAQLIQSDVALCAGVLKLVNSPLSGLRREVTSVSQAINLLGLGSVRTLVTAMSLRNATRMKDMAFLDTFWARSLRLANICTSIARVASGADVEACRSLGLFADCAVPSVVDRYPGFRDFYLDDTVRAHAPIVDQERDRFGIDHPTVSFLLARAWKLPGLICEGIRDHHRTFESIDDVPMEIMVLKLSEHALQRANENPVDHDWEHVEEYIYDNVGISQGALDQIAIEV